MDLGELHKNEIRRYNLKAFNRFVKISKKIGEASLNFSPLHHNFFT